MTARNGRLAQPRFIGTQMTSLCALGWNKPLAHLPCHGTQIAADLLRSGELKFDQLGGLCPSTAGSHGAAYVHSHPARVEA
jgi:hypothetical protein